jgi:hypothetical protein
VSSRGFDTTPESAAELVGSREASEKQLGRARWLAALGGILAGLIAFGFGETIHHVIPVKLVLQDVMMTGKKAMFPSLETINVAKAQNAALAFGLLGLCLGAFLGLAGGLARRAGGPAIKAGLFGAITSSALAVGLCLTILPRSLRWQFDYSDYDLLIALLTHGLIWGLLGALAGMAFAIGLGDRRLLGRALTAGFLGAVLGTVVMELIGAAFFASAATVNPISETLPTRLMARLLVTIGTAAGLILLLKPASCRK